MNAVVEPFAEAAKNSKREKTMKEAYSSLDEDDLKSILEFKSKNKISTKSGEAFFSTTRNKKKD